MCGTHVEVRTTLSQFSSFTKLALGIELRMSGLAEVPLPTDPFHWPTEMFNSNESSASFLCVCVWTRMWRSEGSLQESVLSFDLICLRD